MNRWFSWRLATRLAAREVALRYRGSLGGLGWMVLAALMHLAATLAVLLLFQRCRVDKPQAHPPKGRGLVRSGSPDAPLCGLSGLRVVRPTDCPACAAPRTGPYLT